MQLWNTLSKEDLEEKLRHSGHKFVTISFYQYAKIENPQIFRDHLFKMWSKLDVIGRTYVANEGINAQFTQTLGAQQLDHFRVVFGGFNDQKRDIDIAKTTGQFAQRGHPLDAAEPNPVQHRTCHQHIAAHWIVNQHGRCCESLLVQRTFTPSSGYTLCHRVVSKTLR